MSQTDYLAPADLRIVGVRTTAQLQNMNTAELPAWALVMVQPAGLLYKFNKTKTVPAGSDIQPLSGGPGIWEEYAPGSLSLLEGSAYAPSPYFDTGIQPTTNWTGLFSDGGLLLDVGTPDWAVAKAENCLGLQAAGADYVGAKLLVIVTCSLSCINQGGDPKAVQGCIALASEAIAGTGNAAPKSMSATVIQSAIFSEELYSNLTFQRVIPAYDGTVIQPLFRVGSGGVNLGINALQITATPV